MLSKRNVSNSKIIDNNFWLVYKGVNVNFNSFDEKIIIKDHERTLALASDH